MKENSKLPLILVLALPLLLIVSTELAHVTINIGSQVFYITAFIFPFTFLASLLITKKTQSKNGITLVILSLIIECLVFVLKWVLLGVLDFVLMEVTFFAFFLPHFIILLGYEALRELKKTDKFGYVFFILFVSTLIETMFYLTIFVSMTMPAFIITCVIKLIIDLIIAKILVK